MDRKALLEEIRRRNRVHLPALLVALDRVKAGIRLTRADREAVIDSLEDGDASLAFEGTIGRSVRWRRRSWTCADRSMP